MYHFLVVLGALTFPLLIGFMAPDGGEPNMRLATLAFCGGLSGIALTPVHLCLALSRDYFKTSFAEMYRYLVPLVVLVAAAVFAMMMMIRFSVENAGDDKRRNSTPPAFGRRV